MRSFISSKKGLWRAVELNASKLFVSEECVQKRVCTLCIYVVLSHHILRFPWWRESITGICRQWGGKDGFGRSELLQFSPSSATLQPLYPSSYCCSVLSSPKPLPLHSIAWGLPLYWVFLPQAPHLLHPLRWPPTRLQFELLTLPIPSPAHFLGPLNPLPLSYPTPSKIPPHFL